MKTQRTILTICLSLVLLAATALAGSETRHEKLHITKERGGFLAVSTEKFDVKAGGELTMDDLIGDVTITGGSGNQVVVIQEFLFDVDTEKQAQDAFERYRASVSKSGNSVRVVGYENRMRRYITTSYRVEVPEKFNVDAETMGGDVKLQHLMGEATLETAGGDVEIEDVSGEIEAETAGGDINLNDVEGDVNVKTAGGDVEMENATRGPFTLKTSGGDITLEGVNGRTRASTSGGDMEARHVVGDLDLSTSGGDINLSDVKGASHSASTSGGDLEARSVEGDIELKTSGGDIRASQITGDVYGRTSGGDIDVDAIMGDVEVSTSGGDLELEKIAGRLEGETSGGDIQASTVGKLTGGVKLSSSGGDIDLRLPADVKATIHAEVRLMDPYSDHTIRSDFKLKIVEDDEFEARKGLIIHGGTRYITATGDINGGGPVIDLSTVEGDIFIEKGN